MGEIEGKKLKSEIAEFYTKYHEDPSPDRQKTYLEKIFLGVYNWCKSNVFYSKTDKMSLEIIETVKRCVEREKMPPEDFIKYLGTALYNAKNEYERNDIENHIRETALNKNIRNLIKMWESKANRKLEQYELINLISEWYGINEKKARAYLDGKFIRSTADDDNEEELDNIKSAYPQPETEAIEDNNAEIIKNALETVINEYQDKMEPFYRALFTMRYIKNNKNYERLRPILSADILEMFEQNGKIPTQYEVYMKYHPNAKKSTAETNASQMSKKFYTDIKNAIKEKDPDFEF